MATPEVVSSIAYISPMALLKPSWNDNTFSLRSKTRLVRYLLVSMTVTAKKIPGGGIETTWSRKILHIPHKDHITNEDVRNRIRQAAGPFEDLPTTGKK